MRLFRVISAVRALTWCHLKPPISHLSAVNEPELINKPSATGGELGRRASDCSTVRVGERLLADPRCCLRKHKVKEKSCFYFTSTFILAYCDS